LWGPTSNGKEGKGRKPLLKGLKGKREEGEKWGKGKEGGVMGKVKKRGRENFKVCSRNFQLF